jgi:hypothetical protein
MLTMARRERIRKIYVPTTTRLKGSLDRVIGNLRGEEPYLSRETTLSQQAIVNASWLWMAEMPPAELAKVLAPYIRRFETIWEESQPHGPESSNISSAEGELPAAGVHDLTHGKRPAKRPPPPPEMPRKKRPG